MKTCIYLALLIITLVFFPENSISGVIMEQVRYQKGTSEKQTGNILIEDNKLRFNDLDSNYSSIIDIDNDKVVLMDHNARTYVSTSMKEYLSTVRKKTREMEQDMEKHLSSLPPDQQKTVKELMKKNKLNSEKPPRSKLNVKKTNDINKIAGEDAVKYQVYIDGSLREEIWITEREELRNEIDFVKISEMMKKFKLMSNSHAAENLVELEQYTQLFKKGFPIKTVDYTFGETVFIEEVTDIRTEDIPEEKFQPRSGYTEKTLESLFN